MDFVKALKFVWQKKCSIRSLIIFFNSPFICLYHPSLRLPIPFFHALSNLPILSSVSFLFFSLPSIFHTSFQSSPLNTSSSPPHPLPLFQYLFFFYVSTFFSFFFLLPDLHPSPFLSFPFPYSFILFLSHVYSTPFPFPHLLPPFSLSLPSFPGPATLFLPHFSYLPSPLFLPSFTSFPTSTGSLEQF